MSQNDLYDVSDLEMGGGDDWKADTATIYHKPKGYLRRKPRITELIDQGTGYLTDQSLNHEVRLDWKLNDDAIRDRVFKLTIDEKEVYLDLEELLYYTRVMFTK